jgi:hypothetical protein
MYSYGLELSRDNGDIQNAWCFLNGSGYVADQYNTPFGTYHLGEIKYYVWPGWPDSVYQGFGVACWKIVSGTPGAMVWPSNGIPDYDPNTGGNWIIHEIHDDPGQLSIIAPQGFLVGIAFLYTYPNSDAFGIDNTGAGPYDWANASGTWGPPPGTPPYGKGSARVILNEWMDVEPSTLGSLRALYR